VALLADCPGMHPRRHVAERRHLADVVEILGLLRTLLRRRIRLQSNRRHDSPSSRATAFALLHWHGKLARSGPMIAQFAAIHVATQQSTAKGVQKKSLKEIP